jgi:hypothetical protein
MPATYCEGHALPGATVAASSRVWASRGQSEHWLVRESHEGRRGAHTAGRADPDIVRPLRGVT